MSLLDNNEIGLLLKNQFLLIKESKFEYTNSGVFVSFEHSSGIDNYKISEDNLVLNGLKIISNESECEANLFLKNGLVDYLEIWCYNGQYLNKDLENYTLKQTWDK